MIPFNYDYFKQKNILSKEEWAALSDLRSGNKLFCGTGVNAFCFGVFFVQND